MNSFVPKMFALGRFRNDCVEMCLFMLTALLRKGERAERAFIQSRQAIDPQLCTRVAWQWLSRASGSVSHVTRPTASK